MTLDEIENLEGLNAKDIMKKLRDREAMAFNPKLLGFEKDSKRDKLFTISKRGITTTLEKAFANCDYYFFKQYIEETKGLGANSFLFVNIKNHQFGIDFLQSLGVLDREESFKNIPFNPELLGFKKLNIQRHEGITSYSKGDIVKYYIHHSEQEKTWLFQRTLMMHTTLEVNLKVPNHAWGVEFLTNAGVI